MGCTVHLISAPHQPGEMNVPLHSCNFMIPAPLFNICWKLLLLKSIKSTCFQQTFNNFVWGAGIIKLHECSRKMRAWIELKVEIIFFFQWAASRYYIYYTFLFSNFFQLLINSRTSGSGSCQEKKSQKCLNRRNLETKKKANCDTKNGIYNILYMYIMVFF